MRIIMRIILRSIMRRVVKSIMKVMWSKIIPYLGELLINVY